MIKRISIITGSHLCHNPRVIKEASALAEARYEVEVIGAWFDPDLKRKDQRLLDRISFTFVPVVDLTVDPGRHLVERAKAKLGRLAHQILRVENRWQLGLAVSALGQAARLCKGDLVIAHSEPAMMAVSELQRRTEHQTSRSGLPARRSLVGVDMEDWFSEDLLPEARRNRPLKLLRALESKLLHDGSYRACTSRAMAEALARAYDCEPPTVIYNAFPWSDRAKLDGQIKDRRDRSLPSIHWFSQTIGPGRGLEDLFAALPFRPIAAEIHLRGEATDSTRDWINANVPYDWRERVFVHPLVHDDELLSRIAEHDIGFAGEQKYCRSRDLTVTNKILHYLLGGLAVVASDTTGQREVAEQTNGAVIIYKGGRAGELAAQLDMLLQNREQLAQAKAAALVAAKNSFCWERVRHRLLNRIDQALKRRPSINEP